MPLPFNFYITKDVNESMKTCFNRDLLEKYIEIYETKCERESFMLERNALYWSIQALCNQSCGKSNLSEECAMKSRNFLSKSFNPSFILVSYTHLNLGLFEIGRGNMELSNFHLHCCKFGNLVNQSRLKRTISFLEQFSFGEMDALNFASRLPSVFEFICGITLSSQLVTLLQQKITKENCNEIINTGSEIVKLCISTILSRNTDSNSEDSPSNSFEFTQTLLIEGLKLGVYVSSLSRTDLIEECSLRITYLCETDSFNHCSLFSIPFIVMATRVNLQVVKGIKNGSRMNNQISFGELGILQPIDYYEILQRNQNALNLLNSRFSLVSVVHGKLMKSLDEILSNR
ncbi:predicted protein [Naegleria gruberi]|uniref:Predicted protein n=1 Tax=Naegleria gruberi TaxID=5762 RepID=D2VRV5_NAEGR|nr:uncharacterized protein NAEGRDRAFT_71717 [Naegleria gruberi]EFC40532.1 predicted protein [Naegleria gruberi]|eukprot:XP_002673276.1 predicted protein [Naegleria gruberi strain NEG-M]